MSSSRQSKMNRLSKRSKIISHGSKMMNQSNIKRKSGVSRNSKGSTSKLTESRFMSRMKSSTVGGKYGKSGYRKKGSTKYSTVRENGDPIIYRDGIDVTPLPIQFDNIETNNNKHIGYGTYGIKNNENTKCFIPLIEPILHPMSMSQNDDQKEFEKMSLSTNINIHNNININNNNNNKRQKNITNTYNKSIICTDKDNEIDTITNTNEFKKYITNNASILDENIIVNLSETDTQILFEMPSLAVSNNETSKEERENTIKINKEYEFCLLKHSDKDLFTTSETQTYNPPIKDQSICVKPPKTRQQNTQSSQFDIYDSFKNDSPQKIAQQNNICNKSINQMQTKLTNTNMIDMSKNIINEMENSLSFKKNTNIMERAIVQNVMSKKQTLYRVHTTMDKDERNEFDSDDDGVNDDTKPELKVQIDVNVIDPTQPKTKEDENNNENNNEEEEESSSNNNSMTSPHLELLWNYSCKQCEDLACTSLDYNPLNTDLIVGGYGSWEFSNSTNGKIMFWTLKNPTNPTRIYNINKTCVVSLNFSRIHPYLLSAGLFDGNVFIYDIRLKSNNPILKSELNSSSSKKDKYSSSKHTTPVWNVLWEKPNNNIFNNTKEDENKEEEKENNTTKEEEEEEVTKNDNNEQKQENNNNEQQLQDKNEQHQRHKLFSIASDGIIKQWSMKKGFISTNIMSLKRVSNLAAKRGSIIDNTIRSRQASGLCFDFPYGANNRQYYVGTEDGIIHKCSVSYNEQVLRTYYGHNGPIYKIQTSPFNRNKFISCSADWTINIWNANKSKPILKLTHQQTNINESIIDCCWAPFNSTMFASASENGYLSIWNLNKNKKDPIIIKNTKNKIKQIMFAPNEPAILSAHQNGQINVYRLNNINTQSANNNTTNIIHQIDNLNNCFD